MTTTPDPATVVALADAVADVDLVMTERCENLGEYLGGVIAAGTLDSVGRPDKLPELMFPDVDPEVVRRIWKAALPVGYRAGKLAGRPDWTAEGLGKLRAALADAGYWGMARLVSRSVTVHQPRGLHPEHGDTVAETQPAREGGHW